MLTALDSLDRPHRRLNEDLDHQDPFFPLLNSSPHLPRTTNDAQGTQIFYKSRNHYNWSTHKHIANISGLEDGVLLIQEIDNPTISELEYMFRDLDLGFIHQHVVRVKAPLDRASRAPDCTYERLGPASETSSGLHFDGFCSPVLLDALDRRSVQSEAKMGIAMSFATIDSPRGSGEYRSEMFVSDDRKWHKASTRISCCALGSELCTMP